MKNKKSFFGCVLLLAALSMTTLILSANPEGALGAKAPKPGRADIVVIDDLAAFGKLEFPPVSFKHDLHTEAITKKGQDCSACHLAKTEQAKTATWVFKFKRAENTTPTSAELKEIYHQGCLSCHETDAAAEHPSGPQAAECRSCHSTTPSASERQPIRMDKYLHNTHVQAKEIQPASKGSDSNCSACHHVYDPSSSTRLSWKKQEEDSCRACHLAHASPNPEAPDRLIPALEQASHEACLSCHYELVQRSAQLQSTQGMSAQSKSGPYNCAGCHSSLAQTELAKSEQAKTRVGEVPRLDRGQPDAAMLLPRPEKNSKVKELKGSMLPVAFDHKTHEAALDSCSACHHEGRISACSSCHTLEGAKEGGFVNLAEAMHKIDSERSCVGCHNLQTQAQSCAGCHSSMPKAQSTQSCAACHTVPVGVNAVQATDGSLLKLDKQLLSRMAISTVNTRRSGQLVINMQDVPETVSISILASEYKPAELPHRKIVDALDKKLLDSKLAQSFHTQPTTMCQGCHHNSPASLTPPRCASCHSAGAAPGSDGRPPLKAAYHNLCMGCHKDMQLKKPVNTDCAGCHAPVDSRRNF